MGWVLSVNRTCFLDPWCFMFHAWLLLNCFKNPEHSQVQLLCDRISGRKHCKRTNPGAMPLTKGNSYTPKLAPYRTATSKSNTFAYQQDIAKQTQWRVTVVVADSLGHPVQTPTYYSACHTCSSFSSWVLNLAPRGFPAPFATHILSTTPPKAFKLILSVAWH